MHRGHERCALKSSDRPQFLRPGIQHARMQPLCHVSSSALQIVTAGTTRAREVVAGRAFLSARRRDNTLKDENPSAQFHSLTPTPTPPNTPIPCTLFLHIRHVCLQARYVQPPSFPLSTPAACCISSPRLTLVPTDGRKERVQFDKITARVSRLCYGLDPDHVDPAAITMKVISGVYQGVTTVQLDDLVRPQHPSYPSLPSRH